MSLDYNIYLSHIENFNRHDCEKYFAELGLNVEMCPDYSLTEDTGFFPIKLSSNFLNDSNLMMPLVSGFELFCSDYTPPLRKKSIFEKLFQKKQDIDEGLPKELLKCDRVLNLYCFETLEVLTVFAFAAYVVKTCDGVFENAQIERFYTTEEEVKAVFYGAFREILDENDKDQLIFHEFVSW